jgi:hypothetical protein
MEKRTLSHHASTVLAKCEKTGEFVLGQYDSGYPGKNKHWIGRVKLLGGNYFFGKDSDKSPLRTLSREIGEEFSGREAGIGELAAEQRHAFANQDEIDLMKKILLNVEPLQDYFLYHPGQGNNQGAFVIQSVFRARDINPEIIELVKYNEFHGKSLSNEGIIVVKKLKELKEGSPLCQGITGLVIGQTEGIHLPHCLDDLFVFAPIGKPRDSYEAYSDRFEYKDHSKK